jgi:hypothetical protein
LQEAQQVLRLGENARVVVIDRTRRGAERLGAEPDAYDENG